MSVGSNKDTNGILPFTAPDELVRDLLTMNMTATHYMMPPIEEVRTGRGGLHR